MNRRLRPETIEALHEAIATKRASKETIDLGVTVGLLEDIGLRIQPLEAKQLPRGTK